MKQGSVNGRLEAILPVSLICRDGTTRIIETVIDTGFNGAMTLPAATAAEFGLVKRIRGSAILADGSKCYFYNYKAKIDWDGGIREIIVSAIGDEPLVGMSMLKDCRLTIDVMVGGKIVIKPLRSAPSTSP